MRIKRFTLSIWVALLPMTLAFAAGTDEKALRDAHEAWWKATAAKDLDKSISFYADDAIILPPNEAAVTTKDGIRNLWKGFLGSLADVGWTTARVEVAGSDDMAVVTGTYEMRMTDGSKDHGNYCEVWEKKGGVWKCGTDIWNSDLPAASPAPGSAEKK